MSDIGQDYYIAKIPLRLYSDSYLASAGGSPQGYVYKAGNYRIINKAYTVNNQSPTPYDPGGNRVELYAINDITNSYAIGWIRDDDNVTASQIISFSNMEVNTSSTLNFDIRSGLMHQLVIKINNQIIRNINVSSSSYTFSLTEEEQTNVYNLTSNTNSIQVQASLMTFSDGNAIGTSTANATILIPTSLKPRFSVNPSIEIINPINGKATIGKSQLRIHKGTPVATQGATITNVIISALGNQYNVSPVTTEIIHNPNTVVVTVKAIDSRSRTVTWTSNIEVAEYLPVTIDSFEVNRTNDDEVNVSASGRYESIHNLPSYQLIRIDGNSIMPISSGIATANGTGLWLINYSGGGFDPTKSYELELVMTDSLGYTIKNVMTIGTEAIPLSIGNHGHGAGLAFDNLNSAMLQVGLGGIYTKGPINNNLVINDTDILFKGISLLTKSSNPPPITNKNGTYYELGNGLYLLYKKNVTIKYVTGTSIPSTFYPFPIELSSFFVGGMVHGGNYPDKGESANYSLLVCSLFRNGWYIYPNSYAINISKSKFNNGADTTQRTLFLHFWAIGAR